MKSSLKHILKKYLKYYKIRYRFSLQLWKRQQMLVMHYKRLKESGDLPIIQDTGLKVFSQFEEDGMLLYIFALLEMSNKTFIEFGSDDGVNSNSANLYFHHGFNGLFMDGNPKAIERGQYFFNKRPNITKKAPVFKHAMITAENINELIESSGFTGDIGLLSIDIDGNDYWIWKAIHVVSPQVVIIETHNEFGLNDIVVPYDPNYFYPGKHPDYHGASPIAMTKLAKHKGYRLVGSNTLGFNFIYIREDLLKDELPEVAVESLLTDPSNGVAQSRFEPIKDREYLTENFN